MQKKLISVIVPMYNASRFIRKCIKSILNQTYKNFELLIINDGSTDNSLEICSKFNDKRIRIINKENTGTEYARLTGIELSKGEYICFVDADDWITKDYLETLIAPAQKYNVDIVCINNYRVLDKYGLIKFKERCVKFKEGLLQSSELNLFHSIYVFNRLFTVTVWGKLYKSEIVNVKEESLIGVFYGDDLLFNLHVTYNIKSCYLINKCKYYHRYGGGGTLTQQNRYWDDGVKLYYAVKEFAIKKDNKELYSIINYYILSLFHWVISYKYKFIHTPTDELIYFINSVFTSKIYYELCHECGFNSRFITAIREKDTNKILDIIKQDNKSNMPVLKNQLIRFLFKVLN